MSKTSSLVGALVLGCVAAAAALSPNSASAQQSRGGGRPSAYMTQDHHLRAMQLVGKSVVNDKGEVIGTVAEVLVDMNGGPTTVVLSVGKYVGDGNKLIAAPLDHLKLEGDRPMMAGADRATLRSLPSYTYDPMIQQGSAG